MSNSKQEVMEVLTGPERRRRWSPDEKLAMVRESFEPGKTVSMVARRRGVNPNHLFHWRKLYQDGSLSAVSAGEEVVPASKLSDALKEIRELQRLLGKKTIENEILREAVEVSNTDRPNQMRMSGQQCGGTVRLGFSGPYVAVSSRACHYEQMLAVNLHIPYLDHRQTVDWATALSQSLQSVLRCLFCSHSSVWFNPIYS